VLSTTAPGSLAGDDLVDQAFVDGVLERWRVLVYHERAGDPAT
jgi:hypothetical protein